MRFTCYPVQTFTTKAYDTTLISSVLHFYGGYSIQTAFSTNCYFVEQYSIKIFKSRVTYFISFLSSYSLFLITSSYIHNMFVGWKVQILWLQWIGCFCVRTPVDQHTALDCHLKSRLIDRSEQTLFTSIYVYDLDLNKLRFCMLQILNWNYESSL